MNKLIFIIIGICIVVAVGGIYGYFYFEDQQKQLQDKLDAEKEKSKQLALKKKQDEIKARQIQLELKKQTEQKQAELVKKQQELQEQRQLQQSQQRIAQLKYEQLQQSLYEQKVKQEQQQIEANLQAEKDQVISYSNNMVFIRGIIRGYLNFYIPPLPDYADKVGGNVDYLAGFLEQHTWHGVSLHRVSNPQEADITVQWIQNFGSNPLGITIFSQYVQVGLGTTTCYGTWEPFTTKTVEKILWHEFGHTMGYGHSTNPDNIMFATMETKFGTDYSSTSKFTNGDYKVIHFCKGGKYIVELSNDNKYYGFNTYLVPPSTSPSDVINGYVPYYVSCSEDNLVYNFVVCTVESGSYLLVYNPPILLGQNEMNIDIKIYDTNTEAQPSMTWDENAFELDSDYISYVRELFNNG